MKGISKVVSQSQWYDEKSTVFQRIADVSKTSIIVKYSSFLKEFYGTQSTSKNAFYSSITKLAYVNEVFNEDFW